MGLELSLDAALRDSSSTHDAARNVAIRNLAPAYLEQIERVGPVWRASQLHAKGPAIQSTLWHAASGDPVAAVRGLAMVGLGQLGAPELLEPACQWLDAPQLCEDDEAGETFLRECAVIALSLLGDAAPHDEPMRQQILERLQQALIADPPAVRFQAAVGLAEILGPAAEPMLLGALAHEQHERVQENLLAALVGIGPPSEQACTQLMEILQREHASMEATMQAALALAAAGRPEAGPRLLEALRVPHQRDEALEALAALAPDVPPRARRLLERMSLRLWLPAVTRVRAAYALARLDSEAGHRRLRRLAWHPRKHVRQAVAEARALLDASA